MSEKGSSSIEVAIASNQSRLMKNVAEPAWRKADILVLTARIGKVLSFN